MFFFDTHTWRGESGRRYKLKCVLSKGQMPAAGIGGIVLVDGKLHAVLDVDAECGVGTVERAGHGDGHRWAVGLAVPGGVGGRGAFRRFHLRTLVVDLHLLDDLQVGLRCPLFWLGLLAGSQAEHHQS